jgi:hypothetical protein
MKLWAPSLENKAIGCADIDRVLLGIFRLHGTQRSEANQGAGAFEENGGVTGRRKSIKNLNISVKVPESKQ